MCSRNTYEEQLLDREIERLESKKRISEKQQRIKDLKRELGESAGETD